MGLFNYNPTGPLDGMRNAAPAAPNGSSSALPTLGVSKAVYASFKPAYGRGESTDAVVVVVDKAVPGSTIKLLVRTNDPAANWADTKLKFDVPANFAGGSVGIALSPEEAAEHGLTHFAPFAIRQMGAGSMPGKPSIALINGSGEATKGQSFNPSSVKLWLTGHQAVSLPKGAALNVERLAEGVRPKQVASRPFVPGGSAYQRDAAFEGARTPLDSRAVAGLRPEPAVRVSSMRSPWGQSVPLGDDTPTLT